MAIYHVNQKLGCDCNCGCSDKPFATINQAAQVALAGDEIIIHEGVYRERVAPRWGGKSNTNRITYQAAAGEHVVIKGSEVISAWEDAKLEGAKVPVFKAVISNDIFGDYNPYDTKLYGDWLMDPFPCPLHTGDVYFDGQSLYEAVTLDELKDPKVRKTGPCSPWCGTEEVIPNCENTVFLWHAVVDHKANTTTIYAHFGNFTKEQLADHLIEINVRETLFAPSQVNTNYLTVRGIEFAHGATHWAPPTGVQRGMLDTFWSKGWIIEHCHFHDAKTSAVSIGKEISTGDNESTRFKRKPGYQHQLEDVFKAVNRGWSFDIIGSHIIRYNVMHDCGQNGIVGHLGCIGSDIHHNKIYNIAMKHEFFGHEIAGIKLHAALDVRIHHNEFYNCTLGTWLDWEAQGTQVCNNVYYDNYRDIMIEVTHGPCLVANNIFASEYNFDNVAQGSALVNNIFAGFTRHIDTRDRATPYHAAHSTAVTGFAVVYSGDDRVYGNYFIGGNSNHPEAKYGTAHYNGHPSTFEEYNKLTFGTCQHDHDKFHLINDPVYIDHNVYLKDAPVYESEQHFVKSAHDPKLKVYRNEQGLMVDFDATAEMLGLTFEAITTKALGETRLSECAFENHDGSPLTIDTDLVDSARPVDKVCVGPLQNLKVGANTIKIWD